MIAICTHSASYAQEALKPRTAIFNHKTMRGTFHDGSVFAILQLNTPADAQQYHGLMFGSIEVVGFPNDAAMLRIVPMVRK